MTTWRDLAERCAHELKKGDLVAVEGRLQINNFATAEGQKRRDAEIDAVNVENLSASVSKLQGTFSPADESAFVPVPGRATAQSSLVPSGAPASSSNDEAASIFASDDEIPF